MIFRRFLSTLGMTALLALTACGGGGGSSGTSPLVPTPTTPGGTTTVADLALTLSAPSIVNTGTGTVTATVTALDANRNAIPSAAVTLSANNDAVLTIAGTLGSVTNSVGVLQGSIGIGSNTALRTITVSATAGAVTKTAVLQVVSGATGTTANSIELLAASTSVGTGGDGVVITAFVKDVNNNALAAAPVTFKSDTGTLSSVSSATNTVGAATATFASGVDRGNRTANITVTSGAVSKTLIIPITGTKLSLAGPTALIVGSTTAFDVVASDSKGNLISGVTIGASSSLGNGLAVSGSSATNASGQVRYTYTATTAGTDNLVFSGAGATVSPSPALVVSAQQFGFVSPAATSPENQIAAGTPQEIRVLLRNAGVPQVGKTISFAATGGTLSPSAFAVTSDGVTPTSCGSSTTVLPAGTACVTLTSLYAGPLTVQATVAGTSTSTTLSLVVVAKIPSRLILQVGPTAIGPNATTASGNQATVVAKVLDATGNPVQGQTVNFTRVTDTSGGNLLQASAITDSSGQAFVAYRSGGQSTGNNGVQLRATVADFPNISGDAFLTVNQAALFIALGTGNTIANADTQTYRKDWVAYVTDATGIPVNGATLSIKAIPTHYMVGRLVWNGVAYVYSGQVLYCQNEDRNRDGILDAGEDSNGDGQLWPGNVIAVTPGAVQTANGLATISLVYAESYAPWVRVQLTASTIVAGTESKNAVDFDVVGVATDFTVQNNPPAGLISPFGETPKGGATCTPTPQ